MVTIVTQSLAANPGDQDGGERCRTQSTAVILNFITVKKMNSEGHYLVVMSVANYSDGHYIFPEISLPGSDLLYSFFTV